MISSISSFKDAPIGVKGVKYSVMLSLGGVFKARISAVFPEEAFPTRHIVVSPVSVLVSSKILSFKSPFWLAGYCHYDVM